MLLVHLTDLAVGGDYSVVPSLDADADNGVTTYDIVLITRHILGIEPFTSPYQTIAADANNTQTVTTLDVVDIRKVILQMENGFPNNTSWRFVDVEHVFKMHLIQGFLRLLILIILMLKCYLLTSQV